MKSFLLVVVAFFVLFLVAMLGSADAHPRGGRDFNNGFDAGVRAARGGHARNAPPVVEIRRGFFGRVRGVRIR